MIHLDAGELYISAVLLLANCNFFCVSKLSIDLFFKLLVNRYLAINIEGKIGQSTVISKGLRSFGFDFIDLCSRSFVVILFTSVLGVRVKVFNATFNNILIISWQPFYW
jgi:hypothetical protein